MYPCIIINSDIMQEEAKLQRAGFRIVRAVSKDDMVQAFEGAGPLCLGDFRDLREWTLLLWDVVNMYPDKVAILSSSDCIPQELFEKVLRVVKVPYMVENRRDLGDLGKFIEGESLPVWRVIERKPSFYSTYYRIKRSDLPRKGSLYRLFDEDGDL